MLKVDKLAVFYGDIQALWDISFQVQEGEIVTLVGSNGAGKTTTLKTISAILPTTSGSITFQGNPIHNLPPHQVVEAGISLIPEGRKLFPDMTALVNLEMGAYPSRARGGRRETLKRIYKLFPILEERRDQLAKTLSGGEQQMLAIGRGLMSHPKLLMLDEPSMGLAPRLVEELFRVIREVNQQGITILLVEQNIQHALKISNRAYLLESGKFTMNGRGVDLLADEHIKKSYLGI